MKSSSLTSALPTNLPKEIRLEKVVQIWPASNHLRYTVPSMKRGFKITASPFFLNFKPRRYCFLAPAVVRKSGARCAVAAEHCRVDRRKYKVDGGYRHEHRKRERK